MSAQKYRFHVDRNDKAMTLTVRVIGRMPSTLFVDRLADVYRKMESPWLYRRLFDYRNFTGLIEYSDFQHLARKWAYLTREAVYSGKVAVVTHDAFDLARTSTISHLFPQDIIKGFSAIDPALDWLAGE